MLSRDLGFFNVNSFVGFINWRFEYASRQNYTTYRVKCKNAEFAVFKTDVPFGGVVSIPKMELTFPRLGLVL